ncbi:MULTISPECIES: hypothetical protein [Microbacterium]|uniref:hypothetical protein n=1 Tax=Microbacterium TaxID=33882 RepID=UPI00217D2CB3|nr:MULTISPECIES: hypothetical protein [Microbacterium]UWF77383.1 hypothetical protein JSY13_11545 [Microbacterium neungamense]WCM55545.1 hypothetical protein JRG78_11555 [Microbacterium sp. EF45047]
MKGKIGLVIGLGAGYVLGSRAGRERYEQIKKQWLKVWNRDAVQEQVAKVQDFAKSQAAAVPGALWDGAVKVVRSMSGSGTPGQKLDSAIDASKDAAEDVAEAAEDTREAAKKTVAAAKKKSDAKGAGASTGSASGEDESASGPSGIA